jgi:hypothetical protein
VTNGDDEVAPYLVRRMTVAGPGPDCPEPNLLAGFAEGTLAEPDLERVAAHAAACADCRAALDAVEAPAEPERAPAVPRGWLRPGVLAAAAALLVAVGAGIWFAGAPGEEPPPETSARLVAAARELARERPALFAGFVPFDQHVRLPSDDGRERGGSRLLAPAEAVLTGRPAFRWVAVQGVSRYDVSLETPDGRVLWTRTVAGTTLPYPQEFAELAPGARHAWSVAFEGVLGGRTETRRAFRVATTEEAAAFEEARRAVGERVDADLRDLFLAQFALRRGFWDEAERLARTHLARSPSDPAARVTLRHVLLLQGSPEAPAFR